MTAKKEQGNALSIRVLAFLFLIAIGQNAIQLLTPFRLQRSVSDSFLLLSALAAGAACAWASRKFDGSARRTLVFLAVSNFSSGIGFGGTFVSDVILRIQKPLGTPTDVFYVVGSVLLIYAMLRLVIDSSTRESRTMLMLDSTVVAFSLFILA